MRDTFTLREDPGHGWLIVTKAELAQVGLTEADITPYSYQRGDLIALEEDCDLSTFIEAYRARFDFVPLIEVVHNGGAIRGWPGYGSKVWTWESVA